MVFKGWDGEDTIKRVTAVDGDTVKCCDAEKRITVNGVPLVERDYLRPDGFPSKEGFEKVVPEGRLWVMGDRRTLATTKSRKPGTRRPPRRRSILVLADSRAGPERTGSQTASTRIGTRARKARPRWLMASFSCADSSAVVRLSPSGTKIGS